MDTRRYERYTPKKEIMVALRVPPEHQNCTLIGHIVDLSQSGLSFAYLPMCTTPVRSACEIMLKKDSRPFGEPIACEPVYELLTNGARGAKSNAITYETQFSSETYSLPLMKRCGVKFKNLLSASDLQELLGAPGDPASLLPPEQCFAEPTKIMTQFKHS